MTALSRFLLLTSAALATAGVSSAQTSFQLFSQNGTYISAVTPDGTWFAGGSVFGGGTFRYSTGNGYELIPSAINGIPDIAIGGSPVASSFFDVNGDEYAGYWTPSGTTLLPGIGGQSGTSVSSSYGCSDDGAVIVGLGWINAGSAHAFKWTQSTGSVDLGSLGGNSSRANGVSGDGSVVVGWDEDPTGPRRPSYWDANNVEQLLGSIGEAWGVNTDGSVITGDDNGNCFRWTAATGAVSLGKLRASDPIFDVATGYAVSADGDTIVGSNGNGFFGTPFRAFIWRPGAGMTDLRVLLIALGTTGLDQIALSGAQAVSADGNTIGGAAGSFFTQSAFIATIPPSATYYCNGQTNSQGCLSQIGSSGQASASSGSGFHITASNVLPGVSGLLFYSKTGAASTPFNGGTLCVAAPFYRTTAQTSTGSGTCGGAFDIDFNDWIKNGLDFQGFHGGTHVWAQYWSRDPQSAGTTNLTNAVEFYVWP